MNVCCLRCHEIISFDEYKKNEGVCHSCNPKDIQYILIEENKNSQYDTLVKSLLIHLEAKHIMFPSEENKQIVIEAKKAHYINLQWGFFRDSLVNFQTENKIIDQMIADNFKKTVRITITNNHIWADNTHSIISYIKRYGMQTTIQDIPFYICDIRKKIPIIYGKKENIWDDSCIKGAIRNAMRLHYIEENGGREHSWTILDLMKQIEK